MKHLLEDFTQYTESLHSYGHIKSNIKETIIGDINQYQYEEYGIDPDNKDEDYRKGFNDIEILLDDYEIWTDDNEIIKLISIFKQSEYEDSESNRGIEEAKNFNL